MKSNNYTTDIKKQFEGKVIIVTGSTQGSGAETAKLFAARGAKAITICGRQENKGIQIKKEIGGYPKRFGTGRKAQNVENEGARQIEG